MNKLTYRLFIGRSTHNDSSVVGVERFKPGSSARINAAEHHSYEGTEPAGNRSLLELVALVRIWRILGDFLSDLPDSSESSRILFGFYRFHQTGFGNSGYGPCFIQLSTGYFLVLSSFSLHPLCHFHYIL